MAVPLFETIEDLEAAPTIMRAYFAIPAIAALAKARGHERLDGFLHQLRARVTEKIFGAAIEAANDAAGVDDDDGVGGLLEESFKEGARAAERRIGDAAGAEVALDARAGMFSLR